MQASLNPFLTSHLWNPKRAIDARTAYLDLWWSRDGKVWNQSSFKTGTSRNQDDFSTMEPFLTNVEDEHMYLGSPQWPRLAPLLLYLAACFRKSPALAHRKHNNQPLCRYANLSF
jgi:hypothetical protein